MPHPAKIQTKQVPLVSPTGGVVQSVAREQQPMGGQGPEGAQPPTCWDALNVLPYDIYGRERVAERFGITKKYDTQLGTTPIQGMVAANLVNLAGIPMVPNVAPDGNGTFSFASTTPRTVTFAPLLTARPTAGSYNYTISFNITIPANSRNPVSNSAPSYQIELNNAIPADSWPTVTPGGVGSSDYQGKQFSVTLSFVIASTPSASTWSGSLSSGGSFQNDIHGTNPLMIGSYATPSPVTVAIVGQLISGQTAAMSLG